MAVVAVIFAIVASYFAWNAQRDRAALIGIIGTAERERRASVIRGHNRAALLASIGFLIALAGTILG